jgi:hypothetical protein
MPQRYYSPRIERGLISQLYHSAKRQRVPMTTLANRLIAKGLAEPDPPSVIREQPESAKHKSPAG